jgi:hypothetical protein
MSQGIISRNGRQVLFQRNELSACEAGTAMRHGSVGNRVFAKIGANHLRLYLYRVENLAIVYANNRANHLGDDNHVAQMRAYSGFSPPQASFFALRSFLTSFIGFLVRPRLKRRRMRARKSSTRASVFISKS